MHPLDFSVLLPHLPLLLSSIRCFPFLPPPSLIMAALPTDKYNNSILAQAKSMVTKLEEDKQIVGPLDTGFEVWSAGLAHAVVHCLLSVQGVDCTGHLFQEWTSGVEHPLSAMHDITFTWIQDAPKCGED